MSKMRVEELAGLAEILDSLPSQFKRGEQDTLCDLMTFCVMPDDVPSEERESVHVQCAAMVAQMHEAMHNGARVGGLLALNCLVMLDLMMRRSEQSAEKRMATYAALLSLASRAASMATNEEGGQSATRH